MQTQQSTQTYFKGHQVRMVETTIERKKVIENERNMGKISEQSVEEHFKMEMITDLIGKETR